MTANKWLKRAAREYSAHAGIAYVSARRQVLELATREELPYDIAAALLIDATDAPNKAATHSGPADAAGSGSAGEVRS
ncbi:hypothetical protein [Kribbella sp. CA-294648]|uniref:hypothetical protein n=1 Tax=Kribbella sp. CA-294648 TaxID=3239948 RepID=UPI003D8E39A4